LGKVIAILLCVFATKGAHSDILVEPYVAYGISSRGAQVVESSSGSSYDFESFYRTPVYGIRLAYTFFPFFIGLDGSSYPVHTIQASKVDGPNFTYNSVNIEDEIFTARRTSVGVTAGIRFIVMAWVTYYPIATMSVETSSAEPVFHSGDRLMGKGIAAGLSVPILPFIHIRGEYRSYAYNADDQHGESYTTPFKYNLSSKEFLIGISVPLQF